MNNIQSQIESVLQNIDQAASKAHRSTKEITLIAVSKNHPSSLILKALQLQLSHFGENRIQEALQKWPPCLSQFPNASLHLIGPLQSNKAKIAVKLFHFIHSLDRESVIQAIAKEQLSQNKRPTCLIQINSGNEPQKAGVKLDLFHALYQYALLHDINVQGVMCIPPIHDDPATHFLTCKLIADEYNLPFKSFGMSSDFQIAIQHGASHIRVGSAIFGKRKP